MDDQNDPFAVALKAADERINSIDGEHDGLRLRLDKLANEKTILLTTRRALLIQTGELPPEVQSSSQTSPTSRKSFKGMSLAAAARKYLIDIGHPQSHAEVVEALLKGNVKIAAKDPAGSIRTSMQKHPDWFRWVKPPGDHGRWELVEWPTEDGPNNTPPTTNSGPATLSLVQ